MSLLPPDDHDHDLAGLAGLYALDALEGDDLERFEAYLATHPEAREEVDGFRATTARLAEVSATEPPAHLRAAVLAGVSGTRQEPPVVRLADRRAADLRRRAFAFAAAAALILIAAFGGYFLAGGSDPGEDRLTAMLALPDTEVVPLTGIETGEHAGRVVIAPDENRVLIVSDRMPVTAEGRTYELWKIDAAGAHNAGLFVPDADGRLRVELDVDLDGAQKFLVTEEPAGGSPQPTSDPVMQAELA